MSDATLLRIIKAEAAIQQAGYELYFVDYCEDAVTPGLLGQIRGVTSHEGKWVKIGRKANPTEEAMLEILEHELRHVQDPTWDCGNRDVFGRGPKGLE